jgi:hypothetical protein
VTQYTDTAAPAHDPSGMHATATRSRPTIDDDLHTIMINRVAWGGIFAGVIVALGGSTSARRGMRGGQMSRRPPPAAGGS